MYKKIIFTLLIFLAPIGIIEQTKKDKYLQIIYYEYDMIEHNKLHQIDNLFEANEKNRITIKNYFKEVDLLSQKRYISLSEILFHTC
jgi:uncharacterized membrane protein YjjP (DUF1212 family)